MSIRFTGVQKAMACAAMFSMALFGLVATGDSVSASSTVVTRQFAGKATVSITNVQLPGCIPQLGFTVNYSIARPRIAAWTGTFTGCLPLPSPPESETSSFRAPTTITTGRNVHIAAIGIYGAYQARFYVGLDISGSDGEYVGGQIVFDMASANEDGTRNATGSIDVLRHRPPVDRPFIGTSRITKFQVGPSIHCAPSATFLDIAGVLSRPGLSDWAMTLQLCAPGGLPALGRFVITTPSGITITGTPSLSMVGTILTMQLRVGAATREYTGGELSITFEIDLPNPVGNVSGFLRVG